MLNWNRPLLPLGKCLAGGVKHTTGSSVQEAHFAAQHFDQVSLAASTHLHQPQIIGVSCAVLRTSQNKRFKL